MVMTIRALTISVMLVSLSSGCSIEPPPIPIHDEASLLVDIAYDPRAGAGHSHPANIPQEHIQSVLRGLQLQGRDVSGTLGFLYRGSENLAFSVPDAEVLAPLLATGLSKASPRDLVRFYLVRLTSQREQLITSGGLFVRNQHLYVLLANARTSPYALQYENTYKPNSRLDPMLPIVPFKYVAEFHPTEWRISTHEAKKTDDWEGYVDESKVVVIDLSKMSVAANTARQ